MISDAQRAAAEQLLQQHRRYEDTDTDTDAEGHRYVFEACEQCEENWPCATATVAQALLDSSSAAQAGAMS